MNNNLKLNKKIIALALTGTLALTGCTAKQRDCQNVSKKIQTIDFTSNEPINPVTLHNAKIGEVDGNYIIYNEYDVDTLRNYHRHVVNPITGEIMWVTSRSPQVKTICDISNKRIYSLEQDPLFINGLTSEQAQKLLGGDLTTNEFLSIYYNFQNEYIQKNNSKKNSMN